MGFQHRFHGAHQQSTISWCLALSTSSLQCQNISFHTSSHYRFRLFRVSHQDFYILASSGVALPAGWSLGSFFFQRMAPLCMDTARNERIVSSTRYYKHGVSLIAAFFEDFRGGWKLLGLAWHGWVGIILRDGWMLVDSTRYRRIM